MLQSEVKNVGYPVARHDKIPWVQEAAISEKQNRIPDEEHQEQKLRNELIYRQGADRIILFMG